MAATCKHLMSFGNRILWFIWKKIMRHEDRHQIICIKKQWKDLITDPFSRAISKTEDIKDRIKNKTKKKKEKQVIDLRIKIYFGFLNKILCQVYCQYNFLKMHIYKNLETCNTFVDIKQIFDLFLLNIRNYSPEISNI